MSAPVDVLAVLDELIDFEERHAEAEPRQNHEARQARAAIAEQQEILRRLVAWNNNVNGDGAELAELLLLAEAQVGYEGEPSERRHDHARIPAVAELIEAVRALDAKSMQRTKLTASVYTSHVMRLRAALRACGGA
jgi:transcriptional regulator of nitric oxide reductase